MSIGDIIYIISIGPMPIDNIGSPQNIIEHVLLAFRLEMINAAIK
jgi:hypothetical protein